MAAVTTRQIPLFSTSKPLTAFQRETLRRGGPLEVQGRRWGARRSYRRQKARETSPMPCDVLAALRGVLKPM